MTTYDELSPQSVNIQPIDALWLPASVSLDVLRLDRLHTVVSGNKWYKLKYYLANAIQIGANTLATFGGAYSNHIVATAYACRMAGIKCVGFIRGGEAGNLTHTLKAAAAYGMQLEYVSRSEYRDKEAIKILHPGFFWINEGGYGATGAEGAAEIVSLVPNKENYTHIVAAVGTGTMLAGLVRSALPHQQVIGISSMKGNLELETSVAVLLEPGAAKNFHINHDYHFGGYGSTPPELISYITECWHNYGVPLDIVYTSKAFYGLQDMMEKSLFAPGSKVLFIHSGGLQGNLSLPAGTLPFS